MFQEIEKGTLPNLSYEASVTLITKPEKAITRKLQPSVSDEYRRYIDVMAAQFCEYTRNS